MTSDRAPGRRQDLDDAARAMARLIKARDPHLADRLRHPDQMPQDELVADLSAGWVHCRDVIGAAFEVTRATVQLLMELWSDFSGFAEALGHKEDDGAE